MEIQRRKSNISDKELSLKRMGLSPMQNGVTKLTVSYKEKRKQLWDNWKAKHPESQKTWRTDKIQSSDTLRCQAQVIVKRISANILEQTDSSNEESKEPAGLERSNSIQSEISDIDVHIPPAEVRRIQEQVQDMRERADNSFTLDPIFSSPVEVPRVKKISEI